MMERSRTVFLGGLAIVMAVSILRLAGFDVSDAVFGLVIVLALGTTVYRLHRLTGV